jgi:hypothetical protein
MIRLPPSVSFLDISPAKAGREFRTPSGSSLTQRRRGQNDPYPRILQVPPPTP